MLGCFIWIALLIVCGAAIKKLPVISPGSAALVAVAVVTLWMLWRQIMGPRTPKGITAYIMRHFDTITDFQLQKLELRLAKNFPHAPEADLVYALRISTAIRRIIKLETLASRWNIAHTGAANRGLLAGIGLPDYRKVHSFLSAYFLNRFNAIAEQTIREAQASQKSGALVKAVEKIDAAQYKFFYPLAGLAKSVQRWRDVADSSR